MDPGAKARPGAPVDQTEVEWQLDALDLRPVERWLAALPGRPPSELPTLTVLAKPPRRLVDRYLDTVDWRVGRAGLVLRTRHQGRREEATIKDTAEGGPQGLRRRLEVTETLTPGGIGQLGDDGPVGRRLTALRGGADLRLVVEVRTRRRPFALRVDGHEVAEIALDETTIAVGPSEPPVRLRRVEVEVSPAWVEGLAPVVDELRETCGLQPAKLSKFEAGLLALGQSVPGPPDLGPTEVDPQASLGELAYAVLRRHLSVLLAKEPGTRLGDDVEELHDMRVATRRLRAALDLFAAALPVRAASLRSELSWLADALGAVRDLDVQLERMTEMNEWVASSSHSDTSVASPLEHLRELLEEERDAARRRLIEALDSPRWERLASGLTALVRNRPVRRSAAFRSPAVVEVVELVEGKHRSVAKAARRAKRSEVAADYHRLRIRAKRLRYSLEFTADLYGGRTEAFTRKLARIQDLLGQLQDAEVASARLLALATDGHGLPPLTVFTMGTVAEHYRSESRHLVVRIPKWLKVLTGKEWASLAELMEERRDETRAQVPPLRLAARPPDPVGGSGDGAGASGEMAPAGRQSVASSAWASSAADPGQDKTPPELAPPASGPALLAAWPDPVWGPPPGPVRPETGAKRRPAD